MNKTELTSAIAAKAGLTKVDAKKALDEIKELYNSHQDCC